MKGCGNDCLSRGPFGNRMGPALEAASIPLRTWLILAALWVVTHPWEGLRHDGILYAAQAMSHLRPEVFRGDLFFAYGSQDDFTVFGRLYAGAVGAVGLSAGSWILWGLCQMLWFAVALAWIRRLVPVPRVLVVAAITFSLPVFYSGDGVLRFAESFLTARSLAEPLTLGGLLAVIVGRKAVGIALLVAAAVVHPIMAMPGFVSAGFLLLGKRAYPGNWRAALILSAAGVTVLLLANGMLSRMDERWYEQVALRSPFVLVGEWQFRDWVRLLYPSAVLALIAWRPGSPWRGVWTAVAACGFIGIALSAFASIVRWEHGLQAQFWRFAWLSAWAVPVAAVATVCLLRNRSSLRIAIASTIPVLAFLLQGWWTLPSGIAVGHLILLAVLSCFPQWESPAARRLACMFAGFAAAGAIVGGLLVLYVLAFWPTLPGEMIDLPSARHAVTYLAWAFIGLTAWMLSRRREVPGTPRSGWVLPSAAVLTAILLVDARTPQMVQLDRLIRTGIPEWASAIPADASVFWPEHLPHVWFVLARQSYASRSQLAGSVFSKLTAEEGGRRLENVRAIGGRDAVVRFRNHRELAVTEPPGRAELAASCGDPGLDFVVLEREITPTVAEAFFDAVTGKHYHLHRCADFRQGVTPVASPGRNHG